MPVETFAEVISLGAEAYAVRHGNYVSVFFTSTEGVVLVDPCGQTTPRLPFLIREAIAMVTDQPVRYVVYSHWGADHGRGGAAFAETARFVAHRNAAPRVAAEHDPSSPAPDVLVERHERLSLGELGVDLYPTDFWDGDDYLIVHEPRSKVLLTIDFVQSKTVPFRRLFGVPARVVERLQWLDDTLEYEHVISGHTQSGVLGTRADVLEQRQYYLDLGEAISRTDGDAVATRALLEPRYGTWRRFDQMLEDNVAGYLDWNARLKG